MLVVIGLLVLLLVWWGSANSLHWLPGQSYTPTTDATDQQTRTSKAGLPSGSMSALLTPSVPVGKLLYSTARPACDSQQRSVWSPNATAHVTCNPSTMTLTTSGETVPGVFLSSLSTGEPIPDNYILQV